MAALVSAFGKGLDVVNDANAVPVTFSGTKLHDLADHLTDRLSSRAVDLVTECVAALNPLLGQLPGSVSAVMSVGKLVVTVHGVVLTVQPQPLEIGIAGSVGSLPVVDHVSAAFTAGPDGIHTWSFGVGPAAFDLGGPVLRPVLRGGRTVTGWEVHAGLALDGDSPTTVGHKELFARWREPGSLDIVARTRGASTDDDSTDPGKVALFAADAVLELLGNYVIEITEVSAMLNRTVNGHTVRELLQGSLLSSIDDHAMAPAPISNVPHNLFALARKLAGALPALPLGPISLAAHLDGDLVGLRVNVTDPVGGIVLNPGGSTQISLVTDSSWIQPPSGPAPDPGVIIDLVRITSSTTPTVTLAPAFAANGVGVHISSASGPLLDAGLRIESVAVHLFGRLEPGSTGVAVSGGVHVELAGLAVPLGPGGGDNTVAQGVVADAGGSGAPPTPKFSPALAIQAHHGGDGIIVSLSAGSGDGPWYLPIQRAFGPLYLEQVGLGTGYAGSPRSLDWISVSLDGSVSLFGITASVDKLRLTYHVNQPFFDAHSWEVDLDGFAVSSSIGGLTLAGALLKTKLTGNQTGVDYLGMLKIGFNGYGIDLFGGYSNPTDSSGDFASFFAFGALHAPLGGPPAFFITGIGIGFGINRELKAPTMETITSNPFLVAMKALGPAPEPKQQLLQMQQNIQPKRGEYWVAAGISFTSFVLISGEVVVTVAFGDGLEITLLGLARAELPAPVLKLVSIELALLARFSSKEGTLLVQAQLTENSWLLTESVRLTGGFAFATWWKGPNAGQFVVTMGGYHPKFHHDGYPVVPRLGFRWQPIDNVSIIGESYFALCSEALMAGTRFEASAHFGPAYARVSFGADGIVYFDPFWFSISAYAEIAAGIKLWLLFGTVTIELSLGAEIEVSGPPIHVEGRFEICGFEVPFEFGDTGNPADKALKASEFRDKYLRASSDAQVLQASVVVGSVAAGRKTDGSPAKVPDGSVENPFQVVPEFEVVFITTAPAIDMSLRHEAEANRSMHHPAPDVGVAPMLSHDLSSDFHIELIKLVAPKVFSIQDITVTPRADAAFPKGVWGEAQDMKAKTVPAGETVNAADGFSMSTSLGELTGAPPIDYHQVEIRIDRKRKPLPFVTNSANANGRRTAAQQALKSVADSVRPADGDVAARFAVAARVLDAGGYGAIGVAALRGERASVPTFGSLADDLAVAPTPESLVVSPTIVDHTKAAAAFVAPQVMSLVSMPVTTALPRQPNTTVSESGRAVARLVPTMQSMRAEVAGVAPASLVLSEPRFVVGDSRSLITAGSAPLTRLATSPVAAVANARPDASTFDRLSAMSAALNDGLVLRDGDVAIVHPGSRPQTQGTRSMNIAGRPCRVVALAAGGNVLVDEMVASACRRRRRPDGRRVAVQDRARGVGCAGRSERRRWHARRVVPRPVVAVDRLGHGAGSGVDRAVRVAQGGRQQPTQQWRVGQHTRAVRAARVVTRFDRPVQSIAVAIDDLAGLDAASAVEMHLIGAERIAGSDGELLDPVVLVQGLRSVLVYGITPIHDETVFDPNVTVVVEHCRNGQLAGVAASLGSVDQLVQAVSLAGLDAAIAAALPGGTGERSVTWIPAKQPDPPTKPKAPPRKRTRAGAAPPPRRRAGGR